MNVSVNVSEALTEKRLKPFSESLGDLSRFGGMIGKSGVGLMLGLQLPIPRSKALFKSITVFELLYTGLHCKRLQCKALNSRISDLKIRLSCSKKFLNFDVPIKFYFQNFYTFLSLIAVSLEVKPTLLAEK